MKQTIKTIISTGVAGVISAVLVTAPAFAANTSNPTAEANQPKKIETVGKKPLPPTSNKAIVLTKTENKAGNTKSEPVHALKNVGAKATLASSSTPRAEGTKMASSTKKFPKREYLKRTSVKNTGGKPAVIPAVPTTPSTGAPVTQ